MNFYLFSKRILSSSFSYFHSWDFAVLSFVPNTSQVSKWWSNASYIVVKHFTTFVACRCFIWKQLFFWFMILLKLYKMVTKWYTKMILPYYKAIMWENYSKNITIKQLSYHLLQNIFINHVNSSLMIIKYILSIILITLIIAKYHKDRQYHVGFSNNKYN